MNLKMPPVITLHSGAWMDYLHPETSEFTIEDIAHGLSNTCRFSGQCEPFYSVAQHSVSTSLIVPPAFAMHGLLHDGSEAFMCDLPSPLKQLLPSYQQIEEHVQSVIVDRFVTVTDPTHSKVKLADLRMLATERRDYMPYPNAVPWPVLDGIKTLDARKDALTPKEAKYEFLERYYQLKEKV